MPGLSGIDVARHIGRRAHLVFVTAYDEYAVAAFAHGVMDYIVKPVDAARLAETIHRVKERLRLSEPATNVEEALRELAERLAAPSSDGSSAPLRWLRAQAGRTVRLIAVEDIEYLRSDTKYTRIAWRDGGACAEALVRTPLKELAARLDSAQFAQVHRSVVVNLAAISHVERGDRDHAEIHLRGRAEVLPVSRRYLHLFRQNVTADAPAVASRRSPPCGLCPWGASARRSRPRTCRSSADAAGSSVRFRRWSLVFCVVVRVAHTVIVQAAGAMRRSI